MYYSRDKGQLASIVTYLQAIRPDLKRRQRVYPGDNLRRAWLNRIIKLITTSSGIAK